MVNVLLGFRKMQGCQKIKNNIVILYLIILVTLILTIDFADAKKGKWKPGIENYRRFPSDRTSQNDRRIPPGKTILKHIDRTLQNDKRIPTGKVIENDRTLQNDKRIPTGKVIENDRRIYIDRTLQNDRRIATGKTIQNNRRTHTDREMENDRLIQYNKRVHSARTNPTDGIMEEAGRIRINRILENDRLSENELQRKIDSLTQNKNMQPVRSVQGGRRILNERMQNDRKRQNDLKVENARRILDERKEKMIKASRARNDKRMWAATPHIAPPQLDNWVATDRPIARQSHNASGTTQKRDSGNTKNESLGDVPGNFFESLLKALRELHDTRPSGHSEMTSRACHIIATTYISALSDYKRYYTLKYFYQDILAYEVGYLVSEIIFKYQRMLEIYDMATEYYFKHQEKAYATTPYVLYLYTNVLELGTEITHVCNMLYEIEDKYKFIPVNQTGFDDYQLKKKSSKLSALEEDHSAQAAARLAKYEKELERIKRAARKERKKARNKNLNFDTVPTPPDRRPKVRAWPLIYGWSIEEHLW